MVMIFFLTRISPRESELCFCSWRARVEILLADVAHLHQDLSQPLLLAILVEHVVEIQGIDQLQIAKDLAKGSWPFLDSQRGLELRFADEVQAARASSPSLGAPICSRRSCWRSAGFRYPASINISPIFWPSRLLLEAGFELGTRNQPLFHGKGPDGPLQVRVSEKLVQLGLRDECPSSREFHPTGARRAPFPGAGWKGPAQRRST